MPFSFFKKFLNPLVEGNGNDRFTELAYEWDKPPRVETAARIADFILKNIPISKEWCALDIGCGTGLLTLFLQPHLKCIDAIDPSEGMIEVLKRKLSELNISNVNPIRVSVEEFEPQRDKYDLIVSSMTFHHIKDIPSVLKKLDPSLKRGGFIAIGDLYKEDGTFHPSNGDVYHFGFTEKDFENFFSSAGWKLVKFEEVYKRVKNGKEYPIVVAIGFKP
jgi:ubiquinone/menaquinone biosynthesis C-methylase UbiE